MVNGVFVENVPFIGLAVEWGQAVRTLAAVLDTGFTGDLQVTPKVARELGLEVVGVVRSRIANGQVVSMPTALALASMEGAVNYINVLIANSIPLVGISFLSKFGYKAIVDCKHRTVMLEK